MVDNNSWTMEFPKSRLLRNLGSLVMKCDPPNKGSTRKRSKTESMRSSKWPIAQKCCRWDGNVKNSSCQLRHYPRLLLVGFFVVLPKIPFVNWMLLCQKGYLKILLVLPTSKRFLGGTIWIVISELLLDCSVWRGDRVGDIRDILDPGKPMIGPETFRNYLHFMVGRSLAHGISLIPFMDACVFLGLGMLLNWIMFNIFYVNPFVLTIGKSIVTPKDVTMKFTHTILMECVGFVKNLKIMTFTKFFVGLSFRHVPYIAWKGPMRTLTLVSCVLTDQVPCAIWFGNARRMPPNEMNFLVLIISPMTFLNYVWPFPLGWIALITMKKWLFGCPFVVRISWTTGTLFPPPTTVAATSAARSAAEFAPAACRVTKFVVILNVWDHVSQLATSITTPCRECVWMVYAVWGAAQTGNWFCSGECRVLAEEVWVLNLGQDNTCLQRL